MLDENDTTPSSDDTATSDTATSDTAASGTEAPAPRRRRATKAAAAPASAPADPAGSDAAAPDAAAPDAAGNEGPLDAAPAKKAPAKRVRKAAPRKALQDVARDAGDPAAESADAAAAAAPAAAATDAAAPDAAAADDAAPAKRTRKRVAAAVTFVAPVVDEDLDAEAVDEVPADDASPAPRRRRRAGTAGAIAPAAFLAAPEAPTEPGSDDDDAPRGEDDDEDPDRPPRRRRGRRGRGRPQDGTGEDGDATEAPVDGESRPATPADDDDEDDDSPAGTRRRRRRRRRTGSGEDGDDEPGTVTHVREPREAREPREPRARSGGSGGGGGRSRGGDGGNVADEDGVRGISGSTRMAAKRARRQEGRDSGRRRPPILSEAEFLARREAVDRTMVVRQQGELTQIAVLEDGVLVEHYVTKASAESYAGNVYLGRVQNVLPSMEAAFVDIGKGRNGVLYAGEVNYDGHPGGRSRSIESVLKSGQEVLVQVSKDPIGHKGARLTSQISLPGRYLVYVPGGSMTGISRKLPEGERDRLKAILKKVVPEDAGVIIRTAAEGASEEEIARDVRRLQAQWEVISTKAAKGGAPVLLHAEPDLVIKVVRDVFNEDFTSLVVQGESEWDTIKEYVEWVAPDLAPRLSRHESDRDIFAEHRIDEQLAKALDRKVHLPSGGSLVIDRTEAMVVVDVNTGKYVGKGGNLEETVTRNNLEAAEEIARQLRLRDVGGIIVIDFIDMVLETNRDLVVRRLVECLGRDRTKHQVAEVTSLGLVQMTRKRVGQGLLESFSHTCEACNGRGVLVSGEPVDTRPDRSESPRGRDRKPAAPPRGEVPANAPKPPKAEPAATDDAEPGEAGPKRRRRGGRGRGPAEPSLATVDPSAELAEVLAADDTVGTTEAAAPTEPATDEPTAAVTDESATDEPSAPAAEASTPEAASDPVVRRRRRATSRPAGPPTG